MNYIDGMVCAVPTASKAAYLRYAQDLAALFKDHGALQVTDTWGDDVPEGKLTSFTMAVKREEGETVVFSWITWPSRAARDQGWQKLMADSRMEKFSKAMPFDGKRMIYGGFEVISQA
ncbi:DUF1428 domain-containing protein [Ramlibacter sp. PS4R-6]|uniref:DUF1428 domain-containing protein n=1 Tax=Ramlibacter sp. PS4R-6 TaxID=3133438 RepID=UPI0030A5D6C5